MVNDDDVNKLAYAVAEGYKTSRNRENAMAFVMYKIPFVAIDTEREQLANDMWDAIDAYIDLYGEV